ncbi:unnamed protein product [Rotaria sordida]|uniref:Mos1 transposase HTH domain-containing protein n=1 Tax=Rotaria sordida TaxID=392033 RepID=A0A814TBA2_9BILA|nr:unnamed protein product [Rotaria sordida]CAF1023800.1 unnamed protein product [Rotaria sordida]CAF1159141.1 unnamed protein product [Rotaria sordida]CAF1404995.1 unnamed protein product [Rotaria sordida]
MKASSPPPHQQQPPPPPDIPSGSLLNLETLLAALDAIEIYISSQVRTALNVEATTIHDELRTVFGDEAPSYRTIARWAQWFREGREEIEDEERSRRPVTESTPENIEEIRSIVSDDPHVTIAELQEYTDLSYSTVHRILSDHLELRKITARYIPKQLTDYQRSERVRICKEYLSRFTEGG